MPNRDEFPLRLVRTIPRNSDLFQRLHADLLGYLARGAGIHAADPAHNALGLVDVTVVVSSVPPLGSADATHGQVVIRFRLSDGREGHFNYLVIPASAELQHYEAQPSNP